MRRVFLSVFMFVGLASAVHAAGNAQLRAVPYVPPASVTPPPTTCPYAIDNGCAAAIAGQPGSKTVKYGRQVSGGMLQQLTGSTTDETQNPNNINEPGVDYEVGAWMTTANMKDPLSPVNGIVATTGGACTYSPTGGVNGPQIDCGTSSNLDIENYDMTRGGTTCIPLTVASSTAGVTLTVKDNYWLNNGNCSVKSGGQSKVTMVMLVAQGASHAEFAYNTMDDNNQVWPYPFGSCPADGNWQNSNSGANTICNPYWFSNQGNANIHHNFIKNFRGDILQYYTNGVTPLGEELVQNNMIQGCCAQSPNDHAEFQGYGFSAKGITVPQSLGYRIIGNTILATTDHMNNGNGGFVDQLASMSFMSEWVIADNFIIYGTSGGATPNVVVGGSVSGTTFTTSSISAGNTFGSGETLLCQVTGHTADQFFLMSIYNGGAGSISAGPAGGGHSTPGNSVSNWGVMMYGNFPTMGASLSGTVLNVTVPTFKVEVGDSVFIPGVNISATITSLGTGTGGAGTYNISGAGGTQANEDGVQLFKKGINGNLFPGQFSIAPGVTVPCFGTGNGPPSGTSPNQVGATRGISFTNAALGLISGDSPGGPRAGTQITRNTLDLFAYGPTVGYPINDFGNQTSPIVFNGTLNGTTLTCNSGNCAELGAGTHAVSGLTKGYGNGLLTGASWPGVLRGTYITSGTNGSGPFQVSKTYSSQVGPMSMSAAQTICTDHPTTFGNNVSIDGVYTSSPSLNAWSSDPAGPGDGCTGTVGAATPHVDVDDLETIGPFPSWTNVITGCGATGNGTTDDTASIQACLTTMGNSGANTSSVLYFPAGTYKISSTLTLNCCNTNPASSVIPSVHIIGHAPADTKISWAGSTSGVMFQEIGGTGTSFSRLTWEGNSSANTIGVAHWYNQSTGKGLGTSPEHVDEVFQNLYIGIMGGRTGTNYGGWNSEGQIRRVKFSNMAYAGFDSGSFNALDWWVFDSQFVNCARGVTDFYTVNDSGPAFGTTGANLFVYRSTFQNSSVADVNIGNTNGFWASIYDNVSSGSAAFILEDSRSNSPHSTMAVGNRVILPADQPAISIGNLGVAFVINNQIRGTVGGSSPAVVMNDSFNDGRTVFSYGNQYTVATPIQVSNPPADRVVQNGDSTVAVSSISTTVPAPFATPSFASHTIFEVAPGASTATIQTAINSAASAGGNAIVHIQPGVYSISSTLSVPASAQIQITGDSWSTVMNWAGSAGGNVFTLVSPSYATIRDMMFVAVSPSAGAVSMTGADQVGGRVFLEGNTTGPVSFTNLTKTSVRAQENPYLYNQSAGVASPFALTLNGVADATFIANGNFGPASISNSTALISDFWYEGDRAPAFDIHGSGAVSLIGGLNSAASHTPVHTPLATPVIVNSDFTGSALIMGQFFDMTFLEALGYFQGLSNTSATGSVLEMGIIPSYSNPTHFSSFMANSGAYGVYLPWALNSSNIVTTSPNLGTSTSAFISQMLPQFTSLVFDTAPFSHTAGATDVRLYRLNTLNATSISIGG